MGWAGIVPEKMSGLGIEFAAADQRAILIIVVAVVVYFWCAFLIYALSDFVAWRTDVHLTLIPELVAECEEEIMSGWGTPLRSQEREAIDEYKAGLEAKTHRVLRFVTPTSTIRALLDFLLPIIVGPVAVIVLASAAIGTIDADQSSEPTAITTKDREIGQLPPSLDNPPNGSISSHHP